MPCARRREIVIRSVLTLMGAITATPVFALVAPDTLAGVYGVRDLEPMALALLQHRGMLQMVLGAALVCAAWVPAARVPAAVAAITTKSTFLALTMPQPELPAAFRLVVAFDVTCIVVLAGICVQRARERASRYVVKSGTVSTRKDG